MSSVMRESSICRWADGRTYRNCGYVGFGLFRGKPHWGGWLSLANVWELASVAASESLYFYSNQGDNKIEIECSKKLIRLPCFTLTKLDLSKLPHYVAFCNIKGCMNKHIEQFLKLKFVSLSIME